MSIEEAIIDWAATRPFWQRMILRKVAKGEEISPDDVSMLVDRIVGDKPDPDEAFSVDDLPARTATGLTTVRMLELRNARNVNALLQ